MGLYGNLAQSFTDNCHACLQAVEMKINDAEINLSPFELNNYHIFIQIVSLPIHRFENYFNMLP